MALSWAEHCSVGSRWWSAELMDASSKAPDKKPAAASPSPIVGENLQLPNIQRLQRGNTVRYTTDARCGLYITLFIEFISCTIESDCIFTLR